MYESTPLPPIECVEAYSNITSILIEKRIYLVWKRVFDIVCSFIGVLVLLIPMALIAIIICLDSKGPFLYKQKRVGRYNKLFFIYKFRTMIVQAEQVGMQITKKGDRRITRVGRILRKTKLDEIPQLFNVLFGHMSLVGPRPEVPKYVALYNKTQRFVLQIRPGITDYASIAYRDEEEILFLSDDLEKTYCQEIMPAKLLLNLEYLCSMSVFEDLKIIFLTIKRVLL